MGNIILISFVIIMASYLVIFIANHKTFTRKTETIILIIGVMAILLVEKPVIWVIIFIIVYLLVNLLTTIREKG